MTLDQAAAYALGPIQASLKSTEKHATRKRGALLTTREREVTSLIAQGLTNRAIASSLGITERTVDAHVEHIFNKLGFNLAQGRRSPLGQSRQSCTNPARIDKRDLERLPRGIGID